VLPAQQHVALAEPRSSFQLQRPPLYTTFGQVSTNLRILPATNLGAQETTVTGLRRVRPGLPRARRGE